MFAGLDKGGNASDCHDCGDNRYDNFLHNPMSSLFCGHLPD
jgi:hypothetical protein